MVFQRMQRRFSTGNAAIPDEISEAVRALQLQRVLSHVPMIYAVAIFNLILVMVLCAHRGLPLASYGWMGVVGLGAFGRMLYWMRQRHNAAVADQASRLLNTLTIVAMTMIAGLSAWTIFAYQTGLITDMMLIPISLVFGSTVIAHCLAPIRSAAVGVLIVGVLPCGAIMLLTGDFETRMLGASMITVMLLMIVFVLESYDRIINGIVMEEEIRRLALSDTLTGLANRRAIMEAVGAAHSEAQDGGPDYALAMLDLDGFKHVNDTYGHQAGDALLAIVAERLDRSLKQGDVVGRTGGDEFLVLMHAVVSGDDAAGRATAILHGLCLSADIGGTDLPISGSIGYALSGRDGDTPDAVMTAADQALYAAKRDHYAAAGDRRRTSLRSAA